MTIYHAHNFDYNIELYLEALQKIARLDYANTVRSCHCCERVSERGINLKKISPAKVSRSEVFEIKAEGERIISIGIKVLYNRKKSACLIIGYNSKEPMIVTAWLNKE